MNDPVESRARVTYCALTAFVVVVWFAILPQRPLFNPDEGRYAEIPREMLAGGDWIIPHLNGLAYIEKPPLQYWATALSLRAFGYTEFAARFYTAVCALVTLSLVGFTAGRLWGAAAGWRAAAVLASMLLFVVMGQLLTLDMSLTLFTTAALCGFLLAQYVTGTRWMLAAWIATALGVLTKGLEAAVVPAAVLVLYSLYSRDASPWRRLDPLAGAVAFLVITVPWHWVAARRLPDFLEFFFVHEHFLRYLTPSAGREEPWWFFGVVFVLGCLPWTWSAIRVVALGWRRPGAGTGFDARLFLWIWVVFIGVFFSLSNSKLIPYLLPALPAVALLIGSSSVAALRRDLRLTAAFTTVAAVALATAGLWAPRLVGASDRRVYFLALLKPLLQIAALLGASGLFVLLQRRREITRDAVLLGVGWCIAGLLLMRAAALVAPVYSGVELARALAVPTAVPSGVPSAVPSGVSSGVASGVPFGVASGVPFGVPIYSVATYDQTLPFYWQRTMTLVAYRGELDFGLRYRPDAEIARIEDFETQWRNGPAAYAVMETSMFDEWKNQGLPMRVIARDVHRVLVSRQ